MIAWLILMFALMAVAQFGISYWRSLVASVASRPLTEQGRAAAHIYGQAASAAEFPLLLSLYQTCPAVAASGEGLGLVRVYYNALNAVRSFASRMAPAFARWAQDEMTVCAQYVAVRIDQRLARTNQLWAEMRAM